MASNEAARSVGSSAPVSRRQIAAPFLFLSPHQAAVLDAAADCLMPGLDVPAARVVTYIDGLLSRFDATTFARHVRVADLRDEYTRCIALLDQLADGDFTAVPRLRQDLIVSHAEVAPFIRMLLDHIVDAIYAPPEDIRCGAADHYHETG